MVCCNLIKLSTWKCVWYQTNGQAIFSTITTIK
jgi:hypothetical protein